MAPLQRIIPPIACVSILTTKSCPDWILPNADYAGYYRTRIGAETLDALLADGGSRLSVPEQVGVVDDLEEDLF